MFIQRQELFKNYVLELEGTCSSSLHFKNNSTHRDSSQVTGEQERNLLGGVLEPKCFVYSLDSGHRVREPIGKVGDIGCMVR